MHFLDPKEGVTHITQTTGWTTKAGTHYLHAAAMHATFQYTVKPQIN